VSLTDFTDETEAEPELTDRPKVRARARKADIERDRRRATLQGILAIKEGRELFWWLLEQFGPTRSPLSFARGAVDVPHTMVGVGMANAGNILLAEITAAAPNQYIAMLAEEQERQELRKNGNG
jgi:hypothetical protein